MISAAGVIFVFSTKNGEKSVLFGKQFTEKFLRFLQNFFCSVFRFLIVKFRKRRCQSALQGEKIK
jgi:hypothetical protein